MSLSTFRLHLHSIFYSLGARLRTDCICRFITSAQIYLLDSTECEYTYTRYIRSAYFIRRFTTVETFSSKRRLSFWKTQKAEFEEFGAYRRRSDRRHFDGGETWGEQKSGLLLEKLRAKSTLSKVQVRLLNAYPHLKRGKYKNSVFLWCIALEK